MDKYIIKGGNKLSGRVRVHGAKNAVLPIMAASVLAMKQARKQFTYAPHNESGCDAIVIGSDEVYSIDVGCNRMMYGHDLGDVPAIAYAPAFGRTTMESLDEFGCTETVRSGLTGMRHLSARDTHTRDMVEAFTGRVPNRNLHLELSSNVTSSKRSSLTTPGKRVYKSG